MKLMEPNLAPPAENRDTLALLEHSPRLLLPLGPGETSPEQSNFHMPCPDLSSPRWALEDQVPSRERQTRPHPEGSPFRFTIDEALRMGSDPPTTPWEPSDITDHQSELLMGQGEAVLPHGAGKFPGGG